MTPKQKAHANIKAFLKELDAKYDWTYDNDSETPVPLMKPRKEHRPVRGIASRIEYAGIEMRAPHVERMIRQYDGMWKASKTTYDPTQAAARRKLTLSRRPRFYRGRPRTPLVCVETGEQSPSMSDLARKLNMNPGSVQSSIRQGYRIRGKTWKVAA
jgi:hypothetical protein